MARTRWDRTDVEDDVLLLADPARRDLLRAELEGLPGRRAAELGAYPRFRLVTVTRGEDALRRATARVTAAAIDLVLPHRSGLEVVKELRARRRDVAILAFSGGAPASEAVAALMAGADAFHECRDEDVSGFVRALELAIDRRRLTMHIERTEAEVDAARGRLAQLSGDLARALPGLRPPQNREEVVPFAEAARRYLDAAARLYAGDVSALGKRLGVSYFALRRLLARYGVPSPGRSRGHGTRAR